MRCVGIRLSIQSLKANSTSSFQHSATLTNAHVQHCPIQLSRYKIREGRTFDSSSSTHLVPPVKCRVSLQIDEQLALDSRAVKKDTQ
jgi:hypothetical protein